MDRNIDLGEGGTWDRELLHYATSCNIACGGHAGSKATLRKLLQWAQELRVKTGAHPSYPDRMHFGRKPMTLPPSELKTALRDQLQLFQSCVTPLGGVWHHIKPHGALYNDLAHNPVLGAQFIAVLKQIQFEGIVYALAGSPWVAQLRVAGYTVWEEGFVDRCYTDTGQLCARSEKGAVLHDSQAICQQYQDLVAGFVRTVSGKKWPLNCQTLCLHGDTPDALEHAKALTLFTKA